MSFSTLGLPSALQTILTAKGIENPYPIQAKAIPAIQSGKDVLGVSPTGSGKTLGYVLPIIHKLQQIPKAKNRNIQCLVMVPTRELAVQVKEVFHQYGNALDRSIKSMAVFGGVSINPQMKNLMGVDVLIATPGRLLELIDNKALHLGSTEILVLDEADKMLNQGFEAEMKQVLNLLPKRRQNLLFSATLTDKVEHINKLVLHKPVVLSVEPEVNVLELIKQTAYSTTKENKGVLLRQLIKEKEMSQVLVFTASGFKADHVAHKLRKNGINAEAIHGKKSQGNRTHVLEQFKRGEITALVATDILARGIDIQFLPFVINYELPRSPKDFVHRIGRTGRAENPGEALTIVSPEEEAHFRVIQKKMGRWINVVVR